MNYKITETKIKRWIEDGRGRVRGKDYKPWLTVRDVQSAGKSHRVFGHKSGCTHLVLFNLELAVLLLFEWHVDR